MSQERRLLWLKVGSAFIVGFGLLSLLAVIPATSGPMRFLSDLIFWPLDGAQSLSAPETRLIAGIAGGLMVGFGELLWLVSTRVYPNDPYLARGLILPGIIGWFIIDSLGSILAGAPLNALFNISFLAVFLIPLLLPMDQEAFENATLNQDR